ncbi:MAG: hypothetical protein ACP5GC_09370 [Thiomonas sp.]
MPTQHPDSLEPHPMGQQSLAEHAIHGLFHVNLHGDEAKSAEDELKSLAQAVEAMTIGGVVERLGLPTPQAAQEAALWARSDGKGLALDDFYPHVRQILGAKPDGADVCIVFNQQALACQALSQVLGGKARLWRVPFGAAAQKRCGQTFVDLQFDKARLYIFRTGVVILDWCWHYVGKDLPAAVALEANYALSHGNYATKVQTSQDGEPQVINAQTLLAMAQALLPPQWADKASLQPGRRTLYSLVKLQHPAEEEELRTLALWFSHRQTTDYRPKPQSTEGGLLQPFPYLVHALVSEGGASVIAPADMASSFVDNFVPGTGANTYLPLYLASLHNHLWLLAQTEVLPSKASSGKRHEVRDLEELYERTVEFRRYFYFPMISQISLHNAFYQRSQDVLKIAERQRFLEQTTHDIAELLKARRTRWIGRISGAVAGFLLSHELLDILSQSGLPGSMPNLRVWFVETANATPAELEPLVRLVERWDLAVFFGSLAGALLGYWAAWFFDRTPKAE